jgi:hypothetical protein
VGLPELLDRQPDHSMIHGRLELLSEAPGHVGLGRLPVTVLPDEGGGPVQAVGLVPLGVVDQDFIGE